MVIMRGVISETRSADRPVRRFTAKKPTYSVRRIVNAGVRLPPAPNRRLNDTCVASAVMQSTFCKASAMLDGPAAPKDGQPFIRPPAATFGRQPHHRATECG